MATDTIKEEITNILKTITSFGYIAYIVGGAIRDRLTGQPVNDYDICTNMPLEMVKELFPSFHIMKPNQNRNAGVLNIEGMQIEIAELKGKNLLEDVSRRDFTINTILEDAEGNLYDPLHAQEDITKKVIHLVNPDGSIFDEDAFRILRGLRLSAKLGYKIDDNCYYHMLRTHHNLSNATPEKVYSELKKMIVGQYFPDIFMNTIPFLFEILPELANTNVERINQLLKKSPNKLLVRLFIITSELEEEKVVAIAKRLKIEKKTVRYLLAFLKEKDKKQSTKPSQVKTFINSYPIDFIEAFFTYQEIVLANAKKEVRSAFLHTETVYYEALQTQLENQIRNLDLNPSLFSKYGRGKGIVLMESEVLLKIAQQKLTPKTAEIAKYLELKPKSQ